LHLKSSPQTTSSPQGRSLVKVDNITILACEGYKPCLGHITLKAHVITKLVIYTDFWKKLECNKNPQFTQLFEGQDFSRKLNSTERRVWQELENVCRNFLGSKWAENVKEILQVLILLHIAMGCNMSMKLSFPHSLPEFFPWQYGDWLRWTWRKIPLQYFTNWKEAQWKIMSKFVR